MALQQQMTQPSQLVGQLGQDYATQLTGLTSLPLDTSKFAPTVAGQDPLQTQAATLAGQGVGSYQPHLTQAGTYGTQAGTTMGGVSPYITGAAGLTGTGAGTGAGSISSYMSPYQSQVIDASLADYDVQAAKSRLALGAPEIAGVFGGGRHGIAEAEFDALSNRGRGTLQSGLRQRGFEQAQQARQQDLANQMGLVNLQTGLGSTAQDFGRAQIAGLGTLGAGQQAQNQAVLDAQRQTAQMAVQDPINRLNLLGSGVTGLMGGMGATGTTIAEAPASAGSSPLATALGVGLAGADIYSRLQPRITKNITG